ncbi:MAG: hypothetical protein K0Q59_4605, partial [Paenibacillus sp.]|nr:hypothetical protein [Paenibacillus sp.]
MFNQLKAWAKQLKRKVIILFFAYKDARTPWYAKLLAMAVVAYAFSPIDLIPDFIPILGYLDDVMLIPLGVTLVLKMIPPAVIRDSADRAEERMKQGKPKSWAGATV